MVFRTAPLAASHIESAAFIGVDGGPCESFGASVLAIVVNVLNAVKSQAVKIVPAINRAASTKIRVRSRSRS